MGFLVRTTCDVNDIGSDFTEIYNLYYERLFRFAYTLVHNEDDCEDIVSDTFVLVWENWQTIRKMENMKSYLFTAVKNNCLKLLNKQRLFDDVVDVQFINLVMDDLTPEMDFITAEMYKILEKSINCLPERCKLIFLMSREQKLKYKEIAEILNISEKTIQAQLIIATKRITDIIKHYDTTFFNH